MAVASVAFLSSCNKEFTCACTYYTNGVETGTTTLTGEGKNGDDVCNDLDTETTDILGNTVETNCEKQ